MKVSRCKGEGQGSCVGCNEKGIYNRNWMCFLYKIENLSGCYCRDCVNELSLERGELIEFVKGE